MLTNGAAWPSFCYYTSTLCIIAGITMGTLHEVPPSYLRTAQYCIFQLSSFSLFTTEDSSRTGGLGRRCQEVARQTCTVAFEGRQVTCFEITVGPCEFAA